jgi:hypothetical protein
LPALGTAGFPPAIMKKSVSLDPNKKGGTCGCFAFGLIFFLFGAGFFALAFGRGFLKLIDAREWTPTPCTILSSEVQSHGGTYSIEVRFSYSVNDHNYESNRYDFAEGSSSGYDSKAKVVAQIPAGSRTTCYVNPKDPADAVLERGFTTEMYFAGLPLLFAFIGLAGMYFALTGKLSGKQASVQHKDVRAIPKGGTKRNTSRIGGFFGIVFVAAFWNGIVSVFLWQMIEAWKSGRPEIFLTVILIPFVLVGLALIVGIFYSFLTLFNPSVDIVFNPTEVRLGNSIQVQWTIHGRAERISELRIRLEAREEATYRRGTRSYTDKNIFFKKEFFQTTNAYSMKNGSISIPIPEDSMHSLDTGNNKIVWNFFLEGDIKKWPDVEESYEISVLP